MTSRSQYNMMIGAVLGFGLIVNMLMVKYCYPIFASWNPIVASILYVIIALIGVKMSVHSDNPVVSFAGYCLVVLPTGVILCLILGGEISSRVIGSLAITALIVFAMTIASTIKPEFFLSLGGVLFFSLAALIVVKLILALFRVNFGFIETISAAIFTLYIGYDWAKAQKLQPTADNAIDSCVGLYLDIVNLFLSVDRKRR